MDLSAQARVSFLEMDAAEAWADAEPAPMDREAPRRTGSRPRSPRIPRR